MRAVVFDGQLRFSQKFPIPEIPKDWARIRVQFAGICGTDMEILNGYQQFEGVLGHEFVGIVDQCGSSASYPVKQAKGAFDRASGTEALKVALDLN